MKIALIGRHGPKESDRNDPSIWKPRSPLKASAVEVLPRVPAYYGFDKMSVVEVHSSGWVRADQTAEIYFYKPQPAAELNPHTIWTDEEWRKPCFLFDGRDRPTPQILTDFEVFMRPVARLGSTFVRRRIAAMRPGEAAAFITHGPLAEAISGDLLSQWPLKEPFSEFGQGDVIAVEFTDNNSVSGFSVFFAQQAIDPPTP